MGFVSRRRSGSAGRGGEISMLDINLLRNEKIFQVGLSIPLFSLGCRRASGVRFVLDCRYTVRDTVHQRLLAVGKEGQKF